MSRTLVENMDVQVQFGEVSDENEEHIVGNWRKGDTCYKQIIPCELSNKISFGI